MHSVKCFKRDCWVDTNVFDLVRGDIFALNGQTYEVTKAPYMLDGKPHIPAEIHNSGAIVINFDKDLEYIHMVMDYVCSPARDFGDGTMQICDFEGGSTFVYSPRLLIGELNAFCKEHIEKYASFFDKHERQIESGEQIEMPRFW
ncbi:hypothetical protein AB9X29_003755 [Vibrio vulnificus]